MRSAFTTASRDSPHHCASSVWVIDMHLVGCIGAAVALGELVDPGTHAPERVRRRELELTAIRQPQSPHHDREQCAHRRRVLLEERQEPVDRDRRQLDCGEGDGHRRPRRAVDRRQLAEHLSGAEDVEQRLLTVQRRRDQLDVARLDDHQVVGRVALEEQGGARRQGATGAQLAQLPEVADAEPAGFGEIVGLHRAIMNHVSAAHQSGEAPTHRDSRAGYEYPAARVPGRCAPNRHQRMLSPCRPPRRSLPDSGNTHTGTWARPSARHLCWDRITPAASRRYGGRPSTRV